MDADDPYYRVIPRYKPYRVDVEQGKTYHWCSCGRSAKQPFCDGSHKGTVYIPVAFTAQKSGPALFCGCKHSASALCDGSHNNLADEYPVDERSLAALEEKTAIAPLGTDGRYLLDGGCYVIRPSTRGSYELGGVSLQPLVSQRFGAEHLAQYLLNIDLKSRNNEALSWGDAEAQLMVLSGSVEARIGERSFHLEARDGLSLRPWESLQLFSTSPRAQVLLTLCPATAELRLSSDAAGFDGRFLKRLGRYAQEKRQAMADRFYQVLLGPETGSGAITQFIGEVPCSKAAPHRHLYEEVIVVLSGEGWMWTEHWRAPVSSGDVIFLPAQREHSLQCTSAEGLCLVGHFYPSGSPAVNY